MEPAALAFILCFLVEIQDTVSTLTEQPQNTVAMLSESTSLKCRSDEGEKLVWHTTANNSEEVVLWSGYYLNRKACSCCKIDNHEPGMYHLNMTATKETAKIYTCIEPGSLMTVSACLIVIASNLTCNTSELNAGGVTLECAIEVYGDWIPQIEWLSSDGRQLNKTDVPVKNGKVISTVTVPLESQEVYYTASVLFSESGRPFEVTAMNVPEVPNSTWKSPPFYPPGIHANSNAVDAACIYIPVIAVTAIVAITTMAGLAIFKKLKSRKRRKEIATGENAGFMADERIRTTEAGIKSEGDSRARNAQDT